MTFSTCCHSSVELYTVFIFFFYEDVRRNIQTFLRKGARRLSKHRTGRMAWHRTCWRYKSAATGCRGQRRASSCRMISSCACMFKNCIQAQSCWSHWMSMSIDANSNRQPPVSKLNVKQDTHLTMTTCRRWHRQLLTILNPRAAVPCARRCSWKFLRHSIFFTVSLLRVW